MNKELEYIREIQNELNKNYLGKWKSYWNIRCNEIKKALERLEAIEGINNEKIVKEITPQILHGKMQMFKKGYATAFEHMKNFQEKALNDLKLRKLAKETENE